MKAILDTTVVGLTADVLPRGTSGRYYTLTIRSPAGAVEIDATTEGLGVLVAAVLEQFDDAAVADLITNEVGARTARELGHALVAVAEAREQADRVGVQR